MLAALLLLVNTTTSACIRLSQARFGWDALQGAAARFAAGATMALAGCLAWLGAITPSKLPAVTVGNLLGGMIGARRAALSCVTQPACAGGWWPDSVDWRLFNPFFALSESDMGSAAREALIMSHRYGAVLVAALLCVVGVKAVRRGARVAARGWLLLGMLGLQLLLGASMVLANFPLPLALLHNLCAALLLGATVGLSWENSENQA